MYLTIDALSEIAQCPEAVAASWCTPLVAAMLSQEIDTLPRVAAFLGQVVHESDALSRVEENLHYSAARLAQVWPRHFFLPPAVSSSRQDATQYAHRPEALANLVYADRMGNGHAASCDGWRFRGRGLMQLTGRSAYAEAGQAMGLNLLEDPDLLLLPEHAARSAAWYWSTIDGNRFADRDTQEGFDRLTVAINGELLGVRERSDIWRRARRVLGATP
ncbi:MAG: glycoside hydrolase family 19 protein [Variovorax sp.]